MPNVEIYHRPTCPYCRAAIQLFKSKNVSFKEINITKHPEKRPEMIQRAGGRTTVPQIFVNDQHLGGFDDVNALNARGKLDPLLK